MANILSGGKALKAFPFKREQDKSVQQAHYFILFFIFFSCNFYFLFIFKKNFIYLFIY